MDKVLHQRVALSLVFQVNSPLYVPESVKLKFSVKVSGLSV
jgi:hypothetical protein